MLNKLTNVYTKKKKRKNKRVSCCSHCLTAFETITQCKIFNVGFSQLTQSGF